MYIESVPNRNSPPAVLLRESYREAGKVRKRTLANLSCLSADVIEGLKVLLRGGVAVPSAESVFTVERSLPHGHVAAVLGTARGSGSRVWFASAPQDLQPLLQAMLVARVLEPASKLATHRMLQEETATSSLGRVLGLGQCSADDLYRALDWLHDAQGDIERRLARQHLRGSTLVLYDLTSTWLTGRCCELAARGHSRDGKRDDPQIVFGLVCTAEGCPISVQVFKGNTADPATVAAQVAKLKAHFGIERIAWVGDRGMLTSARIAQVLKPEGKPTDGSGTGAISASPSAVPRLTARETGQARRASGGQGTSSGASRAGSCSPRASQAAQCAGAAAPACGRGSVP